MKKDYLKVRIAGKKEDVERLTEIFAKFAKTWGARKIFQCRKYDREPSYHRTLGFADRVHYIKMKIPKENE